MKNNRQPIFKMIHLRGVDTNIVEVPEEPDDGGQGPVIEILNNDNIDPFNLDEATVAALRDSSAEISVSNLIKITDTIEKLLKKEVTTQRK